MSTAMITGASHGIGAAIATELASRGYHLVLNCRQSKAALEKLGHSLSEHYKVDVLTCIGDVSDPYFVEEMCKNAQNRFPGIDVLVNNAGISHIGLLSDMSYEEWQRIMDTNISSVFSCCKNMIPSMVHQKKGHIINISSVWGNTGASCEVAYSASKGAVNAFTKALAKELAPSNIQVNAIACGTIDTAMNACFNEEERHALEEEIPVGRYGSPEEVAQLVAYLATSNAYLTGQIITLDGGWL